MADLYEIAADMLALVDPESGEILDFDRFEALSMERDTKIENMALWYKDLVSDAAQYKEEKDKFAEREKAAKNKAESLKRYLDTILSGEKFQTTRVRVGYRASEKLIVDDLSALDDSFLRYKEPEADKEAIKTALAAGQTVPGCHIEKTNNISIK